MDEIEAAALAMANAHMQEEAAEEQQVSNVQQVNPTGQLFGGDQMELLGHMQQQNGPLHQDIQSMNGNGLIPPNLLQQQHQVAYDPCREQQHPLDQLFDGNMDEYTRNQQILQLLSQQQQQQNQTMQRKQHCLTITKEGEHKPVL